MQKNDERISFELPVVSHSFRVFIEKAVRDKRTMMSFVESPVTTLRAVGVPIKEDCLTINDCDQLIQVLGKLQNLVASGKIAKDFHFEDIFTTYAERNFEEDRGYEKNSPFTFGPKGRPGFDERIDERAIAAPLLSPSNLAEIAMMMQAQISAK